MDLISSLLDVALSRDVVFADNARFHFAIAQNGFPQAFSEAAWIIADKFLTLLFVCNTL